MKRTPLYEAHQGLGARLIDFGGWEMPVQYSSIIDEHLAVRRASGLFDIAHMGELIVSGSDALAFVNQVLTNDASPLAVGEGQYSLLCRDDGGVVDDLYVFRWEETSYLWVVNASRIEAVVAWLASVRERFSFADLTVSNESDAWGAVAVQGPRTSDFIETVISGPSSSGKSVPNLLALQKNEIGRWDWEGTPIWVSRTGYTGEDGFEVYAPSAVIAAIWDRLMAEGHQGCLQPAGLGARDTLRAEMGYPLYGHELSETISPLEAGLGFFVKLDKGDFIGRDALKAQKSAGLERVSVGFEMIGKTPPPRAEYPVLADGQPVGVTTSGVMSPSLKRGIGMALVPVAYRKPESELTIEVRGRQYPARVIRKPLYRKPLNP